MNTVAQICKALRDISECTIIMHRHPDGDTVGSAAALGKTLTKLQKTVHYACSDPITPRYAGLVGGEEHFDTPRGTIIAVDVAAPDMAGKLESFAQKADIVIDHHGSNPCYGKLNLVCPKAAAAGEIMYEVVNTLLPIDRDVAEALYIAVATDTGCFRHGSTTPNTHRVAAELMELGLDITTLNRKLFTIKTRAALMIQAAVLDSLETYADGQVAVLMLTRQMIEKCGANEDDMENIAATGMQIQGVRSAATLREMRDGEFKVSLRSDGSVNAAAVCARFSGGGHAMAAGCTLRGSESDCKERIAQAIIEDLQ